MSTHPCKRVIAALLVLVLVLGFSVPAYAAQEDRISFQKVDNDQVSASLLQKPQAEEPPQLLSEGEPVRVSIFLDYRSTLEVGYDTDNIAENVSAMSYRADLLDLQDAVTGKIEAALGQDLDVVWNLTLAADIISANVSPDQIPVIEKVPGVEKVLVEKTYQPMESVSSAEVKPNMVISSGMTGANQAWDSGYYGAGTRIAIIDTGLDTDHQSFDPAALQHAYKVNADAKGLSYEDYVATLGLLGKEEIARTLPYLNLHKLMPEITADDLYVNVKAPFGINYIDRNKNITHDNDSASEHGSHVAGISSGNRFLPRGDGFVSAADTVYTLGNAPDSQIIVMKVFGENSPTDADYMAALEDAIMLDCDVANLSLGGSNPGGTISLDYQDIMDSLENSNTVVAIAAGNEGHWAAHASGPVPYLYVEDVSMQTTSEPSTYTNSLCVASVDNNGSVTTSLIFDGRHLGYMDGKGDYHDPLASMDPKGDGTGTAYDYVMLPGVGREADYAGIDVNGKIVLVSRGDINFTDKADTAVEHGAIATLVYNDQVDNTVMVMDGYWESEPCAMISKEAGEIIREGSEAHKTEAGLQYFTGRLSVDAKQSPIGNGHDYHTMSAFSSWGVPGDLSMKPEISAPGGNIYSVNGAVPETDQYELMSGTSMATPQIAGISALILEHIEKNSLQQASLTNRALAQSLLMSTADPMLDENGLYISILQQGAGIASVMDALSARSYVTVDGQGDGKVKAELGDDPSRTGSYTVSFQIHNWTEQDQFYDLSADLFTQDTFRDYPSRDAAEKGDASQMVTYMAPYTRKLTASADWSLQSSGGAKGCDFNGDRIVDRQDAQALLDFLVGSRDTIFHEDKADRNGDGKLSTYDVHMLLTELGADAVMVPAGSSQTVTVTLTLTDEEKAYLNETYPNGAYIQAYLYAKGMADDEGAAGTEHAIPVLGFYGSWTDPSMFELGSIQEKLAGTEPRTTYTGEGEGFTQDGESTMPSSYNTLEVEYFRDPGYSYLLGGNPVDPSEKPNPERTAINNKNGDRLHSYKFSPIRNAAASRLQIADAEGNVLFSRNPGPYSGAYYGIMMFFPMWINANVRYPINFVPSSLAEGETFTASISLAPEYNTNMADGTADWDSLGHGATLSSTVRIDNTAPVLSDVTLDKENLTLTLKASDNQYIAGVALFDRSGRTVLASTGSVADAMPGDVDEFTLSLSKANGKKFLVQVFDYAYNVTTYELVEELGTPVPLPQLMAQDLDYAEYDPAYWVGFKTTSTYRDLSTYAKSGITFHAATIADPYIYAVSDSGALYVLHKEDLLNPIRVGQLDKTILDMAYSFKDGKIYALYEENSKSVLATMDPLTGALTEVGVLGISTNTLAVNADNLFYCNELGTSKVYTYTLDTLASPVLIGQCLGDGDAAFEAKGLQSMEYDPNTGNVIWISYTFTPSSWGGVSDTAYLYEIKPDNTISRHEDMMHHLVSLIIPDVDARNDDFVMDDKALSLSLTENEVFLMKSQSYMLTADVLPWTAADRMVYWESSDTSVASVDGKGLVDAVGVGTCTITATSRMDPSLTDTVTIHVSDVKVTLDGIVSDYAGKTTTFNWNLEDANDWTVGNELDTDVLSATAKDDWTFYASTGDGLTMKKVDLFGGSEVISKWNRAMSDMAYSPVFSGDQDLVHMVYMTMWLPAKDLSAAPDGAAWDLSSVLDENQGGSEFVGIASGGPIQYTEQDGQTHDAELLYLLDNKGGVLKLFAYQMDPTAPDYDAEYPYNAGAEYYPSDLLAQGYQVSYYNDKPISSLVVGSDGHLYFAGFNGASSDLYQLRFNPETKSYETVLFASMGEGNWPVALTKVTANEKSDEITSVTALSAPISLRAEKSMVKAEAAPTVSPAPAPAPRTDAQDVVITVTTKDVTTNGLTAITYDPEFLTLKSVDARFELTSVNQEEGRVTFGYAAAEAAPADADILKLTFTPGYGTATDVTITTTQRNDAFLEETETVTVELPAAPEPEPPEPETSEPETSEPETSEPETSEPETSEPETSEPETSEPETSEPETSKPAEKPESPQTGDSFPIVALCLLLLCSGASLVLLKLGKKKF